MTARFAGILFLVLLSAASAARADGPSFKLHENPVDQGRVLVLEIDDAPPDAKFQADLDGIPLIFVRDGRRVFGLAGLDVELAPGVRSLDISWTESGKPVGNASLQVIVRAKDYGTRRITVNPALFTLTPAQQKIAEEQRRRVDAVLGTSTPERLWEAPLLRPVAGKVLSIFGRKSIINRLPTPWIHTGVDLQSWLGDPVRAAASGRVALGADNFFFSGNAVYIDHGQGLITMYFHLSAIQVAEGEMVERGQIIGLTGSTGLSEGAHLHYGLYLNRARIDPLSFQAATELIAPPPPPPPGPPAPPKVVAPKARPRPKAAAQPKAPTTGAKPGAPAPKAGPKPH